MRIAFLDYSQWDYHAGSVDEKPMGGSQSATCYLTRALARMGHEVFLISSSPMSIRHDGVTCFSWAIASLAMFQSLRLDVVVVVMAAGNGAAIRDLLGPQMRIVLWNHHDANQPSVQKLQEHSERDAYSGMAMVSEWQRQRYHERLGVELERMTVLRNAMPPAFAGQFADGKPILACKATPPILAYTSTPFRGLEWLIEAFPRIRAAAPGTRLKIFSSMKVYQRSAAEDDAEFGPLYRRCRATEGVEYVGSVPQPELARAMRPVMMLAYPNIFPETSCIGVMEAMATGCRVVTSDLGALAETTAGFAKLVPFTTDRDVYLSEFVQQTVRVLRECLEQPGAAEEQLRRQVEHINRESTWANRAREWTNWLEHLPPWRV